jgi:hypothetical protein
MKLTIELDESEIKQAIDAALDEQGYTVNSISFRQDAGLVATVEAVRKGEQDK